MKYEIRTKRRTSRVRFIGGRESFTGNGLLWSCEVTYSWEILCYWYCIINSYQCFSEIVIWYYTISWKDSPVWKKKNSALEWRWGQGIGDYTRKYQGEHQYVRVCWFCMVLRLTQHSPRESVRFSSPSPYCRHLVHPVRRYHRPNAKGEVVVLWDSADVRHSHFKEPRSDIHQFPLLRTENACSVFRRFARKNNG